VSVALLLRGCVEAVELLGDEGAERGDDVLSDLYAPVVVLDGGFDVGQKHQLAFTHGAIGAATCIVELRVDDPTAALGVGEGEP